MLSVTQFNGLCHLYLIWFFIQHSFINKNQFILLDISQIFQKKTENTTTICFYMYPFRPQFSHFSDQQDLKILYNKRISMLIICLNTKFSYAEEEKVGRYFTRTEIYKVLAWHMPLCMCCLSRHCGHLLYLFVVIMYIYSESTRCQLN